MLLLQHLSILGLDQNLHSAEYNKTNSAPCICIVTQLAIVGLHMQREPFVQKSTSFYRFCKLHIWGENTPVIHWLHLSLVAQGILSPQYHSTLQGTKISTIKGTANLAKFTLHAHLHQMILVNSLLQSVNL